GERGAHAAKIRRAEKCSSEHCAPDVIVGDRLQPLLAAEPRFLAFRVLASRGVDPFLTGRAVDLPGKQGADFAEADRLFASHGNLAECCDFIDRSAVEHRTRPAGDAVVEFRAGTDDHEAAQARFALAAGGVPLIAQLGGTAPGESANLECTTHVAAV